MTTQTDAKMTGVNGEATLVRIAAPMILDSQSTQTPTLRIQMTQNSGPPQELLSPTVAFQLPGAANDSQDQLILPTTQNY